MPWWMYFLQGVASSSVVSAVLLILLRHILSRELENFKKQLEFRNAAALEEIRGKMHDLSVEHDTRFAKIYQTRADIVAKVSQLLARAGHSLEYVQGALVNDEDDRRRVAANCAQELYQFVDENRVYIDPQLAED